MGRMANMLLIIAVIEVALLLFTGSSTPASDPTLVGNETSTSLLSLIFTPQEWLNLSFVNALSGIFLAVGIGGIIVGSYFVRNEWVAYVGISLIFFSFGMTLFRFHQYLTATGIWGGSDGVLMSLLLLPVIILYIVTVLDFSRGKD